MSVFNNEALVHCFGIDLKDSLCIVESKHWC
uniref:Uncharacterized protein n=1 Tax=Arundo donax TaxID=35708 RepID=A0A0A9BYP9_ARUDO